MMECEVQKKILFTCVALNEPNSNESRVALLFYSLTEHSEFFFVNRIIKAKYLLAPQLSTDV